MRIAFEYFIYTYGPTLALTILAAIFGTLGHAAKRLYEKHCDTEEKKAIARIVASYVEQVWKDFHGEVKMNQALKTAQDLFAKKNIVFDEREMRVYIEAAVSEFNDAFNKPINDAPTADATRRIVSDDGDREESGLLD